MKNPVWMRTRVEDELRSDFKDVARRAQYYPAEAVRLFMRQLVQIDRDRALAGLTLRRSAVRKACRQVAKEMRVGEEREAQGDQRI
ncbi:hypothetical protein [Stenotrophomonas sp.]|uniref:hypothetical protein n=1 Tax=Stenotrophomonas sp. TaxID=69392 RepID=UPI00289A84DD|nr:hypothetical protein [Stenotrophomonas sp.]